MRIEWFKDEVQRVKSVRLPTVNREPDNLSRYEACMILIKEVIK